MTYTFGDNGEASRRLRRLAEVYEAETRELFDLVRSACAGRRFELAIDLGCGPGWSTKLLAACLDPKLTIGLEESESYVAEARANHPQLKFVQHDILAVPFPVEDADLLFSRFLLTHLRSPRAALEVWAQAARPGAILVIHETEGLQSAHPALVRYYLMLAAMQKHYGQELNVGAVLDEAFAGTAWIPIHNQSVILEKSAREMSQLHAANLRTWGGNDFARRTFDQGEVRDLERDLEAIASGAQDAGIVYNTAKRVIAKRK
jgi:trans-aconitate methyltransferase